MPGVIFERPKMTRSMYQALKRQIMREREKIKQEQEQDEALERLKKEKELKKKKEEEDSLTLEQTKDQISSIQKNLETLKKEKHELFSQLKKVLHQEDESRKKAQIKEHNEMMAHMQTSQQGTQPFHSGGSGGAGPSTGGNSIPGSGGGGPSHAAAMYLQGSGHSLAAQQQPPTKYMSVPMHRQQQQQQQQQVIAGVKRGRSPSPTPPSGQSAYGHYPTASKYPPTSYSAAASKQDYPTPKSVALLHPSVSSQVTYVSQSGHTYQTGQTSQQVKAGPYQPNQSSTTKYPPGLSAYSAYPSYMAAAAHHQQQSGQQPAASSSTQKQTAEQQQQQHYPPAGAYQRLAQQPGYHGGGGGTSALPLQQQLEHANQKSGFSGDDKFKLQQRGIMMSVSQTAAAAPPTGGIVSGYPVRTQTTTAYPASQAQVTPRSYVATSSSSRHVYPGQPPARGGYH